MSFILRPCRLLPFCPRAILKLHPTLCAEEEDKEEDDRKGSQKGALLRRARAKSTDSQLGGGDFTRVVASFHLHLRAVLALFF